MSVVNYRFGMGHGLALYQVIGRGKKSWHQHRLRQAGLDRVTMPVSFLSDPEGLWNIQSLPQEVESISYLPKEEEGHPSFSITTVLSTGVD